MQRSVRSFLEGFEILVRKLGQERLDAEPHLRDLRQREVTVFRLDVDGAADFGFDGVVVVGDGDGLVVVGLGGDFHSGSSILRFNWLADVLVEKDRRRVAPEASAAGEETVDRHLWVVLIIANETGFLGS